MEKAIETMDEKFISRIDVNKFEFHITNIEKDNT
jgi:hypothetical protein